MAGRQSFGDRYLAGKLVFVSGGSRGLGRSLCEHFAEKGADIAFCYSSNDQAAGETAARIKSHGCRARAFRVSVLDQPGLKSMVRDIEMEMGGIDVLVNNAGISQPLPLALTDAEDWDKVMDINIKGQFLLTRAIVPGMIKRKAGIILNMGSLAGQRLIAAPVHYAASKAAVKGFTEALCKELSRYHIRVNCLAPGLLEDGVGNSLPEHRLRDYVNHVAMKRVGRFDEVAEFASFLISDKNSYMNGATIVMDGGL